jgi:anti-sigma regulatory factor (Ser/Thr protein kinase)
VITSVKDRPVTNTPHVRGPLGTVVLPVQAESAHLAREWLGLIFDAWSLPDTENAQLCLSELVANIHTHAHDAGDTLRVVVRRLTGKVRVDVYDRSADLPKINRSMEMSESGNGLFLVDAIAGSRQWGFHPVHTGKCVWFAIPA